MKKIIDTFKYGSREAKRVLLFAILAGIASVGLFVAAIILNIMLLFFGCIIGVFIMISLIQTLGINEVDVKLPTQILDSTIGNIVADGATPKMTPEEREYVYSQQEEYSQSEDYSMYESGEIPNNKMADNDTMSEAEAPAQALTEANTTPSADDLDELLASIETEEKKRKRKKEKKAKVKNNIPIQQNIPVQQESFDEEDIPAEELQISGEVVDSYDRKKIKKTLRRYKVKRDHRLVLVDHCDKLSVKQAPAYVWIQDKEFHLLLIEQEPRHITLPIFSLNEITYLKKQPADEYRDYIAFQGNGMLAKLFKPYLPDYIHSTVVGDMSSFKNLYGFGPGIYVTNNSAANIFDLIPAEFKVQDKVTTSNKVNIFFKEAYKSNIKLRDNVLDANGYADSISRILDNMAKSTISYNEFKETLNLMIKNKLITQEFAMYYMDVRDKVSR